MRLLGKRGEVLRVNGAVEASWASIWRVLAVLVIGAMLANWTWVIFAPRSASALPAVQPASGFQAERLFGIAAASGVTGTALMPNVRLVGVFAGMPGFAVLELDGKRQVGLATGKEIVAGTRLLEVASDHVVIERGSVHQQIQLEGMAAASGGRGIPLPDAASAPVSAANAATLPNANTAAQDWR